MTTQAQTQQEQDLLQLPDVLRKSRFCLTDAAPEQSLPSPKSVSPDVDEADVMTRLARPVTADGYGSSARMIDVYQHRLQILKELLQAGDLDTIRRSARARKKAVGAALADNLASAFAATRPLETTYRGFEAFFEAASKGRTRPLELTIVNVDARAAATDASLWKKVVAQVPQSTRVRLTDLKGIILAPGWIGSAARLEKLGTLARGGKAMVVTDFPDAPSVSDAIEIVDNDGVQLDRLKGTEAWKEQVVWLANHLRFREANVHEAAGDDLYISPSFVYAGMLYSGDVAEGVQVAQAGFEHVVSVPTPGGGPLRARWDLRDRVDHGVFENCVVPFLTEAGQTVAWGVQTLSSNVLMNQVPVRRTRDQIEKALLDFLSTQAFKLATKQGLQALKDAINRYLRKHTSADSTAMLAGGEVKSVECVDEKTVRFELVLKMKYVTENYRLKVRTDEFTVDVTSDSNGWNL